MIQKSKKFSRGILIAILITLLITPFLITHYVIPNNIRFLLGQEHTLEYILPLEAEVNIKEDILLVNENVVSPNSNINISKPLTVIFNEVGNYTVDLKLFGLIPIKQVNVDVIEPYELIPCGKTVGVEMETAGILVLGLGSVEGEDTRYYEPCRGKLYTGDLIIEANDLTLDDRFDLMDIIEDSSGSPIDFKINRNGEYHNILVQPVKNTDQNYKLGIWVRDSTQGLGTITYINPDNRIYGALGHGITDIDTKELMTIKNGSITNAQIISITRGEKGVPGEIEGIILRDDSNRIGNIQINSSEGIFGEINNESLDLLNKEALPIALQHEVKEGEAQVLTDVVGEGIKKYEVRVTKVANFNQPDSRGMVVEIIDDQLLRETGGIIQGMSGSPIIQNGKIIGAITHVFVQNPSKGYGIYIENMIKKEKFIMN